MRIAVVSDEPCEVNERVVGALVQRGHEVVRFGSLVTGREVSWAEAGREAAQAVASGDCAEGVFFCWSGTGMSMVANKVPGVRAALCTDAETARLARVWNHANVLVLGNRLTSAALAAEILDAWLSTPAHDARGAAGVTVLDELDRQRT